LKILYERLKNYELVNEWKANLFKIQSEPSSIDDMEIEFYEDDYEMIILKAKLLNDFDILTNHNFYSYIRSSPHTIVFFYLPCKLL